MKQSNNNEVDILLRSLARGREGLVLRTRSGSGNTGASSHLDADELNSYAEGVLPAPARKRYSEHLADCDVCRGIVVGLTSAAGISIRSEVPEQKGGLSLWQKLASFFSPAVLRYAVPALVLTTVIGIGLLAVLRQRQSEFVARNQPQDTSTSTSQLEQPEPATGPTTSEGTVQIQKKAESPATADSFKERSTLKDDQTRVTSGSGAGSGEVASIPPAKDVGEREEISRVEPPRPYAPEPKAAASAPAVTTGETDRVTQLAREQPVKREDQDRVRDVYKNAPTNEHGPNRSTAPRAAGTLASNRRLENLPADRNAPASQAKKAKVGDDETRTVRTVSGRRFAREGNAWVDTAYDPSRTPVKVARGSEQFRALIADEPALRVIAEQLNGVVIVVWKNRAYRIQ